MTRLCTVLLAAGNSSRYGGIKLVAEIDGMPMLRRAALAALDAGTELLVVTGAHAAALDAALAGLGAIRIQNAGWAEGMGGSIACAFSSLLARSEPPAAALVCLADQPRVGTPQLRRLIEAWRKQPDRIVASQFGETLGPPCLFPQRCFGELARLRGPQGARRVLAAHADAVLAIAMPEAAMDIDTIEDYQRLQREQWPRSTSS